MKTDEKAWSVLKICVALFLAVFSIVILAKKVPESKFFTESVTSIENSKNAVMGLSGATLATSLAISALPDDFASPIAGTLSDMNQYMVFILAALLVERMLVVIGTRLAFLYVIPAACGFFALAVLLKRPMLKSFAYKLVIFGMMVIFVIPISTHFVDRFGGEYFQYVEKTIEETNEGAGKINDVLAGGESGESLTDKLSGLMNVAIKGVNELLSYFKDGVKKCINALSIIIVCTCFMPLLTLFFFKWLLKELFAIKIPTDQIKSFLTFKKKE